MVIMFSGYPEVEQSLTFTLGIQVFQDTEEGPRHSVTSLKPCQKASAQSYRKPSQQTHFHLVFSSQPNQLEHSVEEIPKTCSD